MKLIRIVGRIGFLASPLMTGVPVFLLAVSWGSRSALRVLPSVLATWVFHNRAVFFFEASGRASLQPATTVLYEGTVTV